MKQVILFSSARGSSSNATGMSILESIQKPNHTAVVLMQDAVLLAMMDSNNFSQISEGYVLEEHLTKRGFTSNSLKPPFRSASMDDIVKLILGEETNVVGSF